MTNAILRGKPDAGNPHVRFDEGEVASAKPRRGSLLYIRKLKSAVLFAIALTAGAFSASAEVALPEGYAQLDWIQSTGIQWIDTGVDAGADTTLDLSFGHVDYNGSQGMTIFGENRWDANAYLLIFQDGKIRFYGGGSDIYDADQTGTVDYRFVIRSDNKADLYLNGSTTATVANMAVTRTSEATNKRLLLFNQKGATQDLGKFRLYAMKIGNDAGAELRDFVPCRNDEGVAGLWDRVEGKFYGNVSGVGQFLGSDQQTAEAMLSWIQSDGRQYVLTDLDGHVQTAVDFRFSHAPYKDQSAFFGEKWDAKGFLFCMQEYLNQSPQFFGNGVSLMLRSAYEANLTIPYTFHLGDGKISLTPEGGIVSPIAVTDICDEQSDKRISVFGLNGDKMGSFRFYEMKVWANEGGELQGDVRPYRSADGRIGLYNVKTSTFYPNLGTAPFTLVGLAYTMNGTTLCVHDGTLAAADVAGSDAVEKVSAGTLAAGAVTAYPGALTLTQGAFSLQDGVARRHEVAGALTLKGGARLRFDVTADGADCFKGGSLVLDASATAENPVKVNLAASGVAEVTEPLALITGGNLTDDDLAKFALVSDIPAQLVIENGDLKAVAKEAGEATFVGDGANGNWSTDANWQDGEKPQTGAKVNVAATAGGTMAMDIANLSVKTLQYGADAGSFTLGGSPLGIMAAITNLSDAAQTLALPLTLGVGQDFSIGTEGAMSLTGQVTPKFTTLAKGGAGELTIEDMTLHAARDVKIGGGTIKLRTTTTAKPSSDGKGTIEIAKGGQLKVDVGSGNANLTTVEPTHAKTIYVAGDGPDGQGALYNEHTSENGSDWSATFSHVVLTDDASVGGGAMGIREASGSAISDARLSGGHAFTVRTPLTNFYGFTLYSTAFAIDRIVNKGHLQFEGGGHSGTVTNGVHLADGSQTDIFNTTIPATVPLVVDAGATATIKSISGDKNTVNSSITVEEGATLTLEGDKSLILNGPFVNRGTVRNSISTNTQMGSPMSGAGTFESSAGTLDILEGFSTNDFTGTFSKTGGHMRFGPGGAVPLCPPTFSEIQTGIDFFLSKTTEIGSQYDGIVAQVAQHDNWVGVFTANNAELILKGATWNLYDLAFANEYDTAHLVIDAGTTVTASHQVRNGGSVNNSKEGVIELKNGGKLAAKGVNLIAGSLVQTGGELEIGAGGLAASKAKSASDPHFRFEGGTLKATADFSVGNAVSVLFGAQGVAADPRTAGDYVLDLNGNTVNWNTPLCGSGLLTLTGAGSFVSKSEKATTCGPIGGVTVATDPTANVDLSGMLGVASKLTLEKGAKATVCTHFGPVERVRLDGGNLSDKINSKDTVYNGLVTDFSEMNSASGSPAGPFYISYRGQFYVPADKAGEWHFVGAYDDVSYLEIDGEQVGEIKLDNDWDHTMTGSRELTAGWHDFRLFFGQHGWSWGPNRLRDSNGNLYAFGWTTDPNAKGSTDGSKYEAFDPTTLAMRPGFSTVRWQHDNRNCDNGKNDGVLDDWMEPTTTYDGEDSILTTVKDILCSANNNSKLDSRRNRLSGYVYIPTTGTWKVKGSFDDKFCMRLDGEIVVSYNSFDKPFSNDNVPLTEGWHFFDIQIADTYGGYGTGNVDDDGQCCAVVFCAPESDKYLAFTEDNFQMRAYQPGLSGVTTLAAGSVLTSSAADYPICGVLEGSGSLAGGFVFAGGTWRVKAGEYGLTEKVDVTGVTNSGFARSLRKVEVVLAERALRHRYELCAAGDLTDAEAAEIEVTAVAAEDAPDAVLTPGTWRATVANGKLWLVNPRPQGTMLIVR